MALTTNIVAYWKLDETSGTSASDATGNSHTATLQTNASFVSGGKINYGLQPATSGTDAAGACIASGSTGALDFTQYPFSAGAWIKTTNNTAVGNGDMVVVMSTINASPYDSWLIGMHMASPIGTMYGEYRTASNSYYTSNTSTAYNDGAWHYVAFIIDASGNMTLYVDGVSQATGTASGTMSTGKSFSIGVNRPTANTSDQWVGTIDEVGVWSRALSSTEVSQLYNGGAGLQYPFATNPVARALPIIGQAINRASTY